MKTKKMKPDNGKKITSDTSTLNRFHENYAGVVGSPPAKEFIGKTVMIFMEGPFEGVQFTINSVSLKEVNGELNLNYTYSIAHPGVFYEQVDLETGAEFKKELGDFIVYLLKQPDIKIGA